MALSPSQPHPYAGFVHRVDKPARYLGGEYGAAQKDWNAVKAATEGFLQSFKASAEKKS